MLILVLICYFTYDILYHDIKEEIKNLKISFCSWKILTCLPSNVIFSLKYRKNTESEKPKIERAKKELITLSWKCVIFNKKK